MRLLAIVAVPVLVSGCAILVTEREAIRPVDPSFLTVSRATFECGAVIRKDPPATTQRPLYKQQIRDAWGEPDEIERIGATERWLYKKDRLWSGVWGVIMIIPIPFLIPTGREQMAVEFADDQVSSVNVLYQHSRGGGCSLIPIPVPSGHGVFFGCQGDDAVLEAMLRPFCGAYGEKRLNK
jgi:hypothetical protein